MNQVVISVADFSRLPGSRHRKDGDNSADEFFEDYIEKPLQKAVNNRHSKEHILLDLDGTLGYASSFVSQLAVRALGICSNKRKLKKIISIKSLEDPAKKKVFGMQLSKGKIIASALILFTTGLIVGLLVKNIPLITFDTKVDLSTLVAVAGLVATIFIMPFIVDERTMRRDGINTMVVVDLDTVCNYIANARNLYNDISSSKNVSVDQYTKIVSTFKQISSLLYTLSDEFNRCNMLQNFKNEVIADAYTPTYTSCTEKLIINKKLSSKNLQDSQIALDSLFNKVKQYRYRLYK